MVVSVQGWPLIGNNRRRRRRRGRQRWRPICIYFGNEHLIFVLSCEKRQYLNCFQQLKRAERNASSHTSNRFRVPYNARSRQLCAKTIKVLLVLDFIKIKMRMNISTFLLLHSYGNFTLSAREMRKASVWLAKDKFKLSHTLAARTRIKNAHNSNSSWMVGLGRTRKILFISWLCVCTDIRRRRRGARGGGTFEWVRSCCVCMHAFDCTDFLIRRY